MFRLRALSFESFIDLAVNFVNQVDFSEQRQEKLGELGSLLLDD